MTQTRDQVILKVTEGGIAVLMFDCPGKVNLLTSATLAEAERAFDYVARDENIRALIILSGKGDTFISGADLHEIMRTTDAEIAYKMSREGQLLFSKLEDLKKPTVVGINGACLGGGLELALCCKRRIATNCPNTVLGLPEVKLGFVPGLGGTQRLPRLIGVRSALEIVVSGDPVSAQRAYEIGLVDELCSPDDLLPRCRVAAQELIDRSTGSGILDLERTGEAPAELGGVPGTSRRPDPVREQAGELSPAQQDKLFAMTERSIRIKTKGHYPAYSRAIQVMKMGLEHGITEGLELEARAFAELAVSEISRNLVFLFVTTEFAKQSALQMANQEKYSGLRTVAIVGGGMMGSSIASMAVLNGFKVLIKTSSPARLQSALAGVESLVHRAGQKNRSQEELSALLARVEPVTRDSQLLEADVVIEALVEDLSVKSKLFHALSGLVSPDCLLATNTSSLSVSEITSDMPDNRNCVGLHFFYPVDKMPLVEVINHQESSREAISKATALVSRLGKIPLTVKDSPGFLVNRLLCYYLLEAARLVEAGTPLNWVEDAAVDFGMPMGPLALLDEIGLDVAFTVAKVLHHRCGDRMRAPSVMHKVKQIGLLGKKSGAGLYSWDESGRRLGFDPRLTSEIGLSIVDEKPDADTRASIAERLVLPMVDEAARCLDEKVVRRAREIDLAMVLGVGFPAFRGGLLRYADSLGTTSVVEKLETIYRQSEPHREVADLIVKMESSGRRFYARSQENETGR